MQAIKKIIDSLKYVPASVGVKLLGKVDKRFDNYFSSSAALGYDINQAIDFIIDKFQGEGKKSFKSNLQKGNEQGTLRPDEQIARQGQSASETPGNVLKTGAAFGLGALVGGPIGGAVQAAESAASPELKGLSEKVGNVAENVREAPQQAKINPMNSANMAAQAPESVRSGMAKQSLQGSTGAANLIAQFPELGKYLDQLIQSGADPAQAAIQAKSIKQFMPQIQAIEQKVGDRFENVIAQLFGQAKGQNQESAQKPDKYSTLIQAIQAIRKARGG